MSFSQTWSAVTETYNETISGNKHKLIILRDGGHTKFYLDLNILTSFTKRLCVKIKFVLQFVINF